MTTIDTSTITAAANAAGVSPEFASAISWFAGKGIDLGTVGDKALDIIKDGVDDAEKAEKIGEAVAMGTAIGACIPLLGEIGVGEALGAVVAGIYSTFDQFGPEIMAFINPPAFKESDYDNMRRAAIKAGAVPNPGHAPDNEDGCIFPDGTTSGGNYPRHPPPGQKSIRGDVPYDVTPLPPQEDPAYVAADATARAAKLGNLGTYIKGLKAIDVAVAAANAQMGKVGSTAAQRKRLIDAQAEAFRQLWLATDTTGNPPDVAGFRNGPYGLESRVKQPHVVTQAELLASLKSIKNLPKMTMTTPAKMSVMTPAAAQSMVKLLANATTAAHAVVTAAKSGDQGAIDGINATAAAAAGGDPGAIHTMAIITMADAEQWINQMIDRFVFGKAS